MGEKTKKEVEAEKTEAEPELLNDDELEQIAAGTVPHSYAPDGRILPRN